MGSGWDVGTLVVDSVSRGALTFTIDQQAYLQGFDTIMQLFLYNISGGLIRPTDTDTGTAIVTKVNVGPYKSKTRWQGTSSKEESLKPPLSIQH